MWNRNADEDILRILSEDEIEKMIQISAKNLPLNIRGYSFLRHYVLWNKRLRENVELNDKITSDFVRYKLYTKRDGKLENCTFIAISGPGDYNLFISSNDLDELKECLMQTNLIDWNLGPCLTSFEGRHRRNLIEALNVRGFEIGSNSRNTQNTANYVTCAEALAYDIQIPDDVVIRPLQEEHIRLIDDMWYHKYVGSYEYIKSLAALNDSLGIFSRDTGEIRSWVIITEQFTPGMLHTPDEHRGKGYAKLIMKSIARLIAEKYGIGCYVFIMKGNIPSEKLFRQSLGYKQVSIPDDYGWIVMKKRND